MMVSRTFVQERKEAGGSMKDLMAAGNYALVHGLFVQPQAQLYFISQFRHLCGWDIPDASLEQAEQSVPKWPEGRLVAVTLVPYLDDETEGQRRKGLERTFHDLWEVVAAQQCLHWCWIGFVRAAEDRLDLLKGVAHAPGLRWEVIDLGCNRNEKPVDVRTPERSPHAGILAAAMHHPLWVKAMDGVNVPYVYIPGYRASLGDDDEPWQGVPLIEYYEADRKIALTCGGHSDNRVTFAVPSLVL